MKKTAISIILILVLCCSITVPVLSAASPLPEVLNYDLSIDSTGKITSELRLYRDGNGAGMISIEVNNKGSEPVTIDITLEGSENVVFTYLDIYSPSEILFKNARQASFTVKNSIHRIMYINIDNKESLSQIIDYPFSVVFSFKGIELNRYDNPVKSQSPPVSPEQAEAYDAANRLYSLGLFLGVGNTADGAPIFALDRWPTRAEAITMLVRLLGKEDEALSGTWQTPFTDVPGWALPYVGYAYSNGLTMGISETIFGGNLSVTVSQYITFILRALGFSSDSDFAWDRAWELSDELGITYPSQFNVVYEIETLYGTAYFPEGIYYFDRGLLAIISFSALSAEDKNTCIPLFESLIESGVFTREAAILAGLCD